LQNYSHVGITPTENDQVGNFALVVTPSSNALIYDSFQAGWSYFSMKTQIKPFGERPQWHAPEIFFVLHVSLEFYYKDKLI
jgi:hypothetical protein